MNKHKNTQDVDNLGRLHWYHWLVVISSLALTLCAWYITSVQSHQKTEAQFHYQASQIEHLVKERMEKYEEALRAGVAAIHAISDGIDLNSWKVFSSSLSIEEKYPGINGIGVIYYITPSTLENYLTKERHLRPDYTIHPPHEENEYWPITYIEPVAINKKAVGLDMAHENNRFTAAQKARNTGTTQITGPITLVQDAKKTPGFLFYAPFYQTPGVPKTLTQRQQTFVGIVYAPFIMEKLMEGTLLNQNRLVNFNIRDDDFLLYDELHEGSEDFDATPLFSTSISVNMYGRLWIIDVQSTNIFRQQYKNNQPLMILIGGIIIDSMLLSLFLVLAHSNKKAVTLAHEMTKELKLSKVKLSVTIDSMMDGLLTVDHQNQIISVNKAAELMFDLNAQDMMHENFNQLLTPAFHVENAACLTNDMNTDISNLASTPREVVAQRKDGKTFPMEVSATQMVIEGQQMYTCILRDISERKVNDRIKSEFVSTVSHELRTPLTSIRGALGIILGKKMLEIPVKHRKMLEVAYRNSERLTLLINDILDLEKLESGKLDLNFSLIDLVVLAKHAIEDSEGFSHQNNVELVLETSLKQAFIYGDAHRLSQVFSNLISNAVKFSPLNSTVKITIELQQSYYRIGIHDNGPGIDKEFQSRIFQRFAQADSSDTREKGGTGLGLSICKAIIEHHGGSINYQPNASTGTQFYFDLQAKSPPLRNQKAGDTGAGVLICEDDASTASVLSKIVQSAGVTCDVAETAEMARELIANNSYRLLLLDLTLPDADGLDLLREFRSKPSLSDMPIIVVSARAEEGKKVLNGDAVTVMDWLQKPIDPKQLLQATQHALNPLECPRVLHVEDDTDVVHISRLVLEGTASVSHARDITEARQLLIAHKFDLVLLDLELADGSGTQLLPDIQESGTPVMIFSGQSPNSKITSQVNTALTKSMTSNDQLKKAVQKILVNTKPRELSNDQLS